MRQSEPASREVVGTSYRCCSLPTNPRWRPAEQFDTSACAGLADAPQEGVCGSSTNTSQAMSLFVSIPLMKLRT